MENVKNQLNLYENVKVVTKITNRDSDFVSDIVPTHSGIENLNTMDKCVWWSTNVKPNLDKILKILDTNKKIELIIIDNKNKHNYYAEIIDIKSADKNEVISSPDLSITPEYYKDKKFKTWYKLQNISPLDKTSIDLNNLVLRYHVDCDNNAIPLSEVINSRPSFMYVIDKDLF